MQQARLRTSQKATAGADDGTRLFYYFNGLNSAVLEDYSGSAKIVAASQFAERHGFQFVPVSIDYREAADRAQHLIEAISPEMQSVVFCGSSMGGWFARVMQLRVHEQHQGFPSAAIGWNPAYDLCAHADLLIGPQQNYVTLERYQWTQAHSQALVKLERSVCLRQSLPWFVYVDRGDEVIGWKQSRDWHQSTACVVDFPGGCHSFDHYHEALQHFAANWLGGHA